MGKEKEEPPNVINTNVKPSLESRQYEARAALAAAQRLSKDIDNAKNLQELNRIFREAAPLRNRSLGNSLPSLSPSRPKRKKQRKPKQQQQQQKQQQQPKRRQRQRQQRADNRGQEGPFPFPA